ncbi:AI-2E family transporter [Stygiobacter electus]|uniref:AI-2E family transporter n=1 Tax=Stygiobacter electus TaxID=3032292 RepID=A0AAE3P019_9BACT|nr:AI-2E family transporter [Stygiobacter electus]MDF1611809.1 AI-2E family transporter [Stygiobacter electus]
MEKKKYFLWVGFIVGLITLIILSFIFIKNSLIILISSVLISFIFKPVVDFFEKKKIPRSVSVLIIFFICSLLLFVSLYLLIPQLIVQTNHLLENLTEEKIKLILTSLEESIISKFPFLNKVDLTNQFAKFLSDFFINISNNLSKLVTNLFSFFAVLFIIPFLTFFLLKDSKLIVEEIINLSPSKYSELTKYVVSKTTHQLSRYVRGWILDAFIVGSLIAIGLTILGINNSISIGFIAGLGHLIPYFGPVIGGLPALIISLFQYGDFSMLPALIILFAVVYTFDNGIIQPKIFSKSTDLHPVVIIFLILIGNELLGLLGMLIAIPATTVIKTIIKEVKIGLQLYKTREN